MTTRDDERDWVPPARSRQPSFDLHHYNRTPVSVDEENVKSSGIDPNQVPWWTSKRFRLSVLCFLGFACLYAQRVNLSISVVCMVHHGYNSSILYTTTPRGVSTPLSGNDSHRYTFSDADQCLVTGTSKGETGEFAWDKPLQGLLLGAFFWGFMIMQIPGVLLTERFGPKKVIAAGMLPVAILTVLTPPAARASPYLLLAVRIIIGLGEAVVYPASQSLWVKWCPPWERGRLVGISLSGGYLGTALMFPIGGVLCANGFDNGWASMFYIIGILSFLWCVVWFIFAHDSPESTSGISDIERKYIANSIENNKLPKGHVTPWRSILTSGAVWIIIITHMCGTYGVYMLLTQIPSYMEEVLKFDIKSNGLFSMLPYLCFWACTALSGLLADFFIFRDILSVTWTRKVMCLLGMVGPAACLIGLSQMDCSHQAGAVVLLCVAVGLSGFQFSGYFINHGDIAPAYAGTLFGITSTAASIPGILAPYVVSAVTPNKRRDEWETAFYLCAGVYIFGALVYLVFGTGKPRYWAKVAVKSKDEAVALRKPTVNGHRRSRASMRTTYFDNEESHVTIECDPAESYAESAIV